MKTKKWKNEEVKDARTLQYYTIQYSAVQYNTVPYSTLLVLTVETLPLPHSLLLLLDNLSQTEHHLKLIKINISKYDCIMNKYDCIVNIL